MGNKINLVAILIPTLYKIASLLFNIPWILSTVILFIFPFVLVINKNTFKDASYPLLLNSIALGILTIHHTYFYRGDISFIDITSMLLLGWSFEVPSLPSAGKTIVSITPLMIMPACMINAVIYFVLKLIKEVIVKK